MEQGNGQEELVDLSGALEENNQSYTDEDIAQDAPISGNKLPGIYGLVGKLSGGLIKTEKQAKAVLILLIVIMNAITFSLLLKDNGGSTTITDEAIPAQAE